MATSALKLAALAMVLVTSPVLGQNDGEESEILTCYTCTMSSGTDDSCYTDPDNSGSTPLTECTLGADQCCMISRTDNTEELGTPISMFRGCIPDCDPALIGEVVTTETDTATTYESYCNKDRCNNGPGNTKPGGGGGGGSVIDGIDGQDGSAMLGDSPHTVPALPQSRVAHAVKLSP